MNTPKNKLIDKAKDESSDSHKRRKAISGKIIKAEKIETVSDVGTLVYNEEKCIGRIMPGLYKEEF